MHALTRMFAGPFETVLSSTSHLHRANEIPRRGLSRRRGRVLCAVASGAAVWICLGRSGIALVSQIFLRVCVCVCVRVCVCVCVCVRVFIHDDNPNPCAAVVHSLSKCAIRARSEGLRNEFLEDVLAAPGTSVIGSHHFKVCLIVGVWVNLCFNRPGAKALSRIKSKRTIQ